ncbi:hypothetical protein KSP39_PZI016297 [Platanthera zijinensis]|uniref:MRN complex-interacting protein N-terminal domain-containing protein n=1 Tax=Platanthera zijinensis TaxID=2320716 RepID=A0AAP0B633_9ASPA
MSPFSFSYSSLSLNRKMPFLFIAVQCVQCSTMQVKQQKKTNNKWVCVVCNQRQSVLRIHARGLIARELRNFVQEFNLSRMKQESGVQDFFRPTSDGYNSASVYKGRSTKVEKKSTSRWSEYLDDGEDDGETISGDDLGDLHPLGDCSRVEDEDVPWNKFRQREVTQKGLNSLSRPQRITKRFVVIGSKENHMEWSSMKLQVCSKNSDSEVDDEEVDCRCHESSLDSNASSSSDEEGPMTEDDINQLIENHGALLKTSRKSKMLAKKQAEEIVSLKLAVSHIKYKNSLIKDLQRKLERQKRIVANFSKIDALKRAAKSKRNSKVTLSQRRGKAPVVPQPAIHKVILPSHRYDQGHIHGHWRVENLPCKNTHLFHANSAAALLAAADPERQAAALLAAAGFVEIHSKFLLRILKPETEED